MPDLKPMPLFPLQIVLFPGMTLPLNIFERRYKIMIKECLETNTPFGVVCIRSGSEVGGGAVPFSVGTSAYITQVQNQADGRILMQTVGYQRFRIHELRHDRPYLVGLVEEFPVEDENTPQVQELAEILRSQAEAYLVSLQEATDTQFTLEDLPHEALNLCYFTAITLPVPMEDKQKLLESADLRSMLREGIILLRREAHLLRYMLKEHRRTRDLIFSNN